MPPRSSGSSSPTALTLIGSAITLGLSFVASLVLLTAGDLPDGFYTSTPFQAEVFTLIVLAVPLALLVTWGEFDLSIGGAATLGGAVAAAVADGPDDAAAGAVLLAAFVGAFGGVILGLVRWLTRAHPALVSLGAGALLSGIGVLAGPDTQGRPIARFEGSGLPILMACIVVGACGGLVVLFRDDRRPTSTTASAPGPRVILGYAASGLGAGAAGALAATMVGFAAPGRSDHLFVLGFTAVAVAGVVRRSGVAGPFLAIPGAVVATMLSVTVIAHEWRSGERELVLGIAFVLSVALAWGLQRALVHDETGSAAPAVPMAPFAGPPQFATAAAPPPAAWPAPMPAPMPTPAPPPADRPPPPPG